MTPSTIVSHLERYLGKVSGGWKDDRHDSGITIARFDGQPSSGVTTYATTGLSDHVLSMPSGRSVRQELLFAAHDSYPDDEIAGLLFRIGSMVKAKHTALLRGEVAASSTLLMEGLPATAIYASNPVAFPDGIAGFEGSHPPTVVVWLVPLLPDEAQSVRQNGWEQFEDRLEATPGIDLFDLKRPSVLERSAGRPANSISQ